MERAEAVTDPELNRLSATFLEFFTKRRTNGTCTPAKSNAPASRTYFFLFTVKHLLDR